MVPPVLGFYGYVATTSLLQSGPVFDYPSDFRPR